MYVWKDYRVFNISMWSVYQFKPGKQGGKVRKSIKNSEPSKAVLGNIKAPI